MIQSGGFGSFSKSYGTAAGGLLEAEIVVADGKVLVAKACTNPDLFWGIKGGGGGSLGVVTKLTLRTRELPAVFGRATMKIRAASDAAFRRLIDQFVGFYRDRLLNALWGESIAFGKDNTLDVTMSFQGLDQQQSQSVWQPFNDWITTSPSEFTVSAPFEVHGMPAQEYWSAVVQNFSCVQLLVIEPTIFTTRSIITRDVRGTLGASHVVGSKNCAVSRGADLWSGCDHSLECLPRSWAVQGDSSFVLTAWRGWQCSAPRITAIVGKSCVWRGSRGRTH